MNTAEKHTSILEVLRRWALLIVIVALGIIFGAITPAFFNGNNLMNILRQTSIMGILAIGLTFVVVSGEMDLSFSAVASLSTDLMLIMCIRGVNTGLSWLIVLLVGLCAGIVNAIVVVKLKIPSMLGTIGTQLLFNGIVAWIAQGGTIWTARMPELFKLPGRSMIFGVVPFPVVILLVVAVIAAIVLEQTVLGRYFYAVGGNPQASDHAGINTRKIKVIGYLILGVLGGLAGIIISSQFASATPTVGDTYLFPAVIAVYLGSIFLKDGVQNLYGTVLACIFLSELSNGFNLIGLRTWHEDVAQGLIMTCAIAWMILGKNRHAKAQKKAAEEAALKQEKETKI